MRIRNQSRPITTALLSVALLLSVCGCTSTTTGADGSRSKLYGSMAEMVKDTARVVVASVVSQTETTEQETVHTISTVEIQKEFQPESLGVTRPGPTRGPLQAQRPGKGETIEVRQFGSVTMQSTVAPLLAPGETYLLFIVPTGLEGPAASQYYITGVDAGIYRVTGDPAGFERVSKEPGDVLPDAITETDLAP